MPGELIGALRVSLGLDTAQFEAGSRRAQAAAKRDVGAIRNTFRNGVSAISGDLRGLGAGLASGLLISSLAATAKRALDYASSLGEVSQQLGVTTRDLQQYRYAASQVGVSQEEIDKSLSKLTRTMGEARAGGKAQVAVFAELSKTLGTDILKNAATAGDAIPLIADALAKVSDPARRAAIEVDLFGKTGQKLDTLLASGSDAINSLRDAASDLGLVLSDEQIQKADQTADKLSELKQVLEARIAGTVADNAEAIDTLAQSFLKIVDAAGQAITALSNWNRVNHFKDNNLGAGAELLKSQAGRTSARQVVLDDIARLKQGRVREKSYLFGLITSTQQVGTEDPAIKRALAARYRTLSAINKYEDRQAAARPSNTAANTAGAPAGAVSGGRTKKGPSAEQIAAKAERERGKALRDQYEADRDAIRGQLDLNDAQESLTYDVRERGKLAEQRLTLERQGEELETKFQLDSGEINKAQYDKRVALIAQVASLREQASKADEEYRVQQEVIDRHRAIAESSLEVKEMEASLAETAAQRREIELRIVEARFALLRQAQQDILNDDHASQAEKDVAGRKLLDLDKLQAGATTQAIRGTRGPLEGYLSSLPDTADKVNEALEGIAANGLSDFNDGIADAIVNGQSLGSTFGDISKRIIADLIKIGLQMALTQALGGQQGGGGFFSGLASGLGSLFGGGGGVTSISAPIMPISIPGLAMGGSIGGGRIAGIDKNLLSINGMPAARVSAAERIRVEPANDRSNGPVINQTIQFTGAVDIADRAYVDRIGEAAKRGAIAGILDYDSRSNGRGR